MGASAGMKETALSVHQDFSRIMANVKKLMIFVGNGMNQGTVNYATRDISLRKGSVFGTHTNLHQAKIACAQNGRIEFA